MAHFDTHCCQPPPWRSPSQSSTAFLAVAFRLQCKEGGFTMMTLPPVHDSLALRTAIELADAACCFAGNHHPLVLALEAAALNPVSHQ